MVRIADGAYSSDHVAMCSFVPVQMTRIAAMPGWEASKVLPDMVMYCQKESGERGHGDPGPRVLMLELLTVLPEEASSRGGISAPPERRAEFLWTLRAGGAGGQLALRVLAQLMEPGALPPAEARSWILSCTVGWIQLEAVERAELFASPVMSMALKSLESPEACEEACELVTISVEAFTEPAAVEEMLPRLLSRAQVLATTTSEDVCRCLAMVFAAAAVAYLPCILTQELAGRWESLVQIMVGVLENTSLEIAGLSLEFWGSLGELLTETAAGGRGPRSPALEQYVRRACEVAIFRSRYPSPPSQSGEGGGGGSGGMNEDDLHELDDFREKVEDLVKTLILPAPSPEPETDGKTRPPAKNGFFGTGGRGRSGSTDGGNSGMSTPVGGGRGGGGGSVGGSWHRVPSVAVVTPDGGKGDGYLLSNGLAGGVSRNAKGKEGAGGEGAGVGVGQALSPVQEELLAWLEALAVSSARQALQGDHNQHLQQQQQGLGGSGGGGGGDLSWDRLSLSPSVSSLPSLANGWGGGEGGGGGSESFYKSERRAEIVPLEGGVVGVGTGAMDVLVELLPALPPAKRELQRSAAVLVGGLAEWLARRPRSLEPALQFVLKVLQLGEEGVVGGEASMHDKGHDHVGVVALAKLVSTAGPSLASVPTLPTHLLERYLDFSSHLQRHRLHAASRSPPTSSSSGGGSGGGGGGGKRGGGAGAGAAVGCGNRERLVGDNNPPAIPPPPLHAGSLRLFLGSLCRMLGQAPSLETGEGARAGGGGRAGSGSGTDQLAAAAAAGFDFKGLRRDGSGVGAGSEAEDVLRALVGGELMCLGSVLDRRREIATTAAGPNPIESRAMVDVAQDSLSNISLILRKTSPALNAPGLVAHCCGLGEGGGSRGGAGVLVEMVAVFGGGPAEEDKVLPCVCRVFEVSWRAWLGGGRGWGWAEWVVVLGVGGGGGWGGGDGGGGGHRRHPGHGFSAVVSVGVGESSNQMGVEDDDDDEEGGGGGGGGNAGGLEAAAIAAAAGGGLRMSAVLGDALTEAFRRRPFVRFLESLRSITNQLGTLRRHSADLGGVLPDVSPLACGWVDRCLWAAAEISGGGGDGAGGEMGGVGGGGRNGGRGGGGGGLDAHPELVEAMFKLMAEWVNELPVASLRWLEAWLSVAVSRLAVRQKGPAAAVLGLVQACCAQRRDPAFAAAFSALLMDTRMGVALIRGLLSAMCGEMPSWMLEDLVATIRALFDCFLPGVVSGWVETVLLQDPTFERYNLSKESKLSFSRKLKEDFCCKDWRAFKAGLKKFCGGKKKGTEGTPPVHASALRRRNLSTTPPPPPDSMETPQQQHHPNLTLQQQQQQLQQQQQQQRTYGAGVGNGGHGGGGRPYGSSAGLMSAGGVGDGGAAAAAASQAVCRSMTM
eukprot:jgi/Undpi1/5496/HiC_scaffold_2.g00775.m1